MRVPLFAFAAVILLMEDARGEEMPSFNRDVAPIIYANCVGCHHEGGAGPFPMTSYREVRKHAQQIAELTRDHSMPPWLPEPGHGSFVGERLLSATEMKVLELWVKNDAPEGEPTNLKVLPQWNDGWQLGEPDLVLTMPEPYVLPAEGHDEYRNFVIPMGLDSDRYVIAMELRPESAAAHHAFVKFDRRGGSRRLDAKSPEPGYSGMNAGPDVESPAGSFTSWQPGKVPHREAEDMPWVLPAKSDLVLQMHLRPTGKPESIRAKVALYFTDHPPARLPFVLCLRSTGIDIPPGQTDYAIESRYTLPVSGSVLSVLPHLHYLGKEIHAWAELPDGSQQDLLLIKQWNFDWQGDYRYVTPLTLPKGTTLRMRYTYDNSAENIRNPNQPPQRVPYGLESTDEMGEFWMQFLPDTPQDMPVLQRDYVLNYAQPDELARLQAMVERNPHDAASRADLAAILLALRRGDEAKHEAEEALKDDPDSARAHTVLGNFWIDHNQLQPAIQEFAAVVALDPDDADAQNNLGFLLYVGGKPAEAVEHLEKALSLHPDDALARQNLEKARAQLKP